MRNLFDFILKNAHVFLFITLEIICIFFVYQSSSYRQWVINSSSKEISGPFLKARATYKEYIHLKKINENLNILYPKYGGHVGFAKFNKDYYWTDYKVLDFFRRVG